MISNDLIHAILAQYALSAKGIHGLAHWARVLENGRRLAGMTGAKVEVVELFAVFHDARRRNEGWDADHGFRGAELAGRLRDLHFSLSDREFDLLSQACRDHTAGTVDGDVTVQTCWDADRLDLGRVGIVLDRRYLCTGSAKDPSVMKWADRRSRQKSFPELIREEWALGDTDRDG